jgi:hypothetical protein
MIGLLQPSPPSPQWKKLGQGESWQFDKTLTIEDEQLGVG